LALLQARKSVSVLELANVPNMRWLSFFSAWHTTVVYV